MRIVSSLILIISAFFVSPLKAAPDWDRDEWNHGEIFWPKLMVPIPGKHLIPSLSSKDAQKKLQNHWYRDNEEIEWNFVADTLYKVWDLDSILLDKSVSFRELIEQNKFDEYQDCDNQAMLKRVNLLYMFGPTGDRSKGLNYGLSLYLARCIYYAAERCSDGNRGLSMMQGPSHFYWLKHVDKLNLNDPKNGIFVTVCTGIVPFINTRNGYGHIHSDCTSNGLIKHSGGEEKLSDKELLNKLNKHRYTGDDERDAKYVAERLFETYYDDYHENVLAGLDVSTLIGQNEYMPGVHCSKKSLMTRIENFENIIKTESHLVGLKKGISLYLAKCIVETALRCSEDVDYVLQVDLGITRVWLKRLGEHLRANRLGKRVGALVEDIRYYIDYADKDGNIIIRKEGLGKWTR